MKKLLLVLLVFASGMAIDRLLLGIPPRAVEAGAGRCVSMSGDVNADGGVNLTDAITLLSHLFLGSPANLVPLCRTEGPQRGLPATGQTQCYGFVAGQGWGPVDCESAACRGQDGFYAAGCPSHARFVDIGDGTVSDTCTGLQWQKDPPDANEDGRITEEDFLTWCRALSYCEDLSLAGYDDWRLPNVRELHSLVDYGRFKPAIDPVFRAFPDLHWSSTTCAGYPEDVWYVEFSSGGVNPEGELDDDKPVVGAFRAVRGP